MAKMGLKYVAWARMANEPAGAVPTYNHGKVLGKAVSSNLAITNAEGELFADDMLAEYVKEFSSATFTMEVDNIELPNQAELYGATYVDDELQMFSDDNAPYGGIGGYQVLMVGGVRKYRAWFFPKAKASVPDQSDATKGSSISFGTQPLNLKIMPPAFGPWYYIKEFETEGAAKAYIDGKLGVTTWYTVNVQAQGTDTGEAVSPLGSGTVAAGADYVISIAGHAGVVAAYDNGTDITDTITGGTGTYTISGAVADHNVVVVF